MLRDLTAALLNAFSIFWALAVSPFCWILRDGLGPNAIESHGLQAIDRFLMTFYWGPILLALVVLRTVVGGFASRRMAHVDEP